MTPNNDPCLEWDISAGWTQYLVYGVIGSLAICRGTEWAETLFSREGGEKGAAGFEGEKGMFRSGAMQGDELGFAEAHLRGDFVFAEERGVKHCGVVGGEDYRNAMAKSCGKGCC